MNTIPSPRPKTDTPATRWVRRPLRRAMLRAAGIPFALTKQPVPAYPPRRILLIRPDHLGDLLCLTPALHFLRTHLPAAHITALVGPWGRIVLEHHPDVDAVQTLPFPGFTRRPKTSLVAPYRELWRAAHVLRGQSFDAAVVLRFDHWWGAWLAALAGIPRRIGYAIPEVKPFINEKVPYTGGRHEALQNLRLLAQLVRTPEPDATPQSHPLRFPLQPADVDAASALLQKHGLAPSEPFAILQPGSGAAVKLWRAEAFAHVAAALHQRWQLRVLLTGSAEERALSAQVCAQTDAPLLNLAGETTLPQLAALFARARIAIGTDNGPMHLAVAMHTPTVHLFGPVSARAFGPWGDPQHHLTLTSHLSCIACNRLDYSDAEIAAHPCVRLIDEAQVLQAVTQLLGPS